MENQIRGLSVASLVFDLSKVTQRNILQWYQMVHI